jgi:hypothetical protein
VGANPEAPWRLGIIGMGSAAGPDRCQRRSYGAQETVVTGLLLVLPTEETFVHSLESARLLCAGLPLSRRNTPEKPMEDICEQCFACIEVGNPHIVVNLAKPHVFCGLCWDTIQIRWYRRMQKHLPLRDLVVVLAPYITEDIPKQRLRGTASRPKGASLPSADKGDHRRCSSALVPTTMPCH